MDSEHNHLTFFMLFELKNESTTPFALKENNNITPEEKHIDSSSLGYILFCSE